MIDRSESGMAYNRFRNLESIEDRIIYYLLSPTNKSPEELRWVHTIWKLLMYNDKYYTINRKRDIENKFWR